jgi:hypothetical protein
VTTTRTTATLKAIVHTTTVVQSESDTSKPPTPEETVIAVGAGAQIFPDKGSPCNEGGPDWMGDVVASAVAAVVRKTGDEMDNAVALKSRAVRAREDIARAGERKEARRRVEKESQGWGSHVFELEG